MQAGHKTNGSWKFGLLGAALALTLGASTAWATSISFTASGTGGDGAVAAEADFTTDTGVLTVTLTNLLGADVIRSAGQALSDITFVLSNDSGATDFTGDTASGQFGDVASKGTLVTYVSTDDFTGDTTPVRWFANGSIAGPTITLETIGGGQPSQMIAPFVANGGNLSNVNSGFSNFNSYVIGPATFTLSLPGVTADTTILSATFSFGTSPDTFVPGVPVPTPGVPEPGALALLGIGLVVLAASRRKLR